ncbi:hypothetical protein ASPBRDRAFT_673886 [Aspergillus brasiliensis CBS 101740]|uniref:Glutathione S-transferase C-terminal domain-containing protein n=1 Tax=Aspergillus brasiliensis (strain CBS 101740 / IMI 381727 / IBT 21946) TaxID=767769 RepID=A0A1L9U1E8_ASPBC|nr:hypothetical protein ASPBRDRAFT_673886 [Aspergillus brasiliensis CBS 101740]
MGMLFNQIYGNQTEEDFIYKISESRVKATCEVMEQQLAKNTYLAEEKFTAADCVCLSVNDAAAVYSLQPQQISEYYVLSRAHRTAASAQAGYREW